MVRLNALSATRRRGRRTAERTFRERARDALRTEGHRMTQQRDVLLDVIERSGAHLDADGLYRLARERDNRISLSTVYRTLSLLKQHDLVDELHLSEEHHHYEAKTAHQHYHLVCVSCGAVQEFSGEIVDRLREDVKRDHGFQVSSVQLDIAGRCARCARAAA
jgi:Fe2+ or Zn2+ uptake regulation protein